MPLLTDTQKLEKRLLSRLNKAINDYSLIDDGDKILVGLSGGKDSLCLLDLLARRAAVYRPAFSLEAIHIRMSNIRYETDETYLRNFADDRGVKLHIATTTFNPNTDKRKSPCFLCSWNRRKQLFTAAQELGCNKIALGHHMDDIIHTAMMNMFFQGSFSTMPLYLKMRKMPLVIIRPLALECEADIKAYADANAYMKQLKRCPYETDSHRSDMAELFARIERINVEARYSVWNALSREGKLVER